MDNDQKLTVAQLMSNAERLFEMKQYRAVVMKAFTALEERVASVIFSQLEEQAKLPEELINWLKVKTQRSFDDRLHPIGAFALGKPIDKNSKLWSDYQKARKVRNKVSHSAKQVERKEAETVLQTVREWLEYVQGATEAPKAFHENDRLKEFLLAYALLISRFRPKKGLEELSLGNDLADLMLLGNFDDEDRADLKKIINTRREIAHSRHISDRELKAAQNSLRILLLRFKGLEVG